MPPSEPAPSSTSFTTQRVAFGQDSDSLLDHPEKTVPAIFAMLAFVTVVGLALPWLQPDIFKSRLKIINQKRGELSQQRRERLERARPSLRRLTSGRENFMRTVLEKFGGGPVGIGTIAASIGEEAETIEEVYEPYLIQLGFLHRSPRGRMATEGAYEYFKVPRRFGGQPELF